MNLQSGQSPADSVFRTFSKPHYRCSFVELSGGNNIALSCRGTNTRASQDRKAASTRVPMGGSSSTAFAVHSRIACGVSQVLISALTGQVGTSRVSVWISGRGVQKRCNQGSNCPTYNLIAVSIGFRNLHSTTHKRDSKFTSIPAQAIRLLPRRAPQAQRPRHARQPQRSPHEFLRRRRLRPERKPHQAPPRGHRPHGQSHPRNGRPRLHPRAIHLRHKSSELKLSLRRGIRRGGPCPGRLSRLDCAIHLCRFALVCAGAPLAAPIRYPERGLLAAFQSIDSVMS
jgi:hypothetical protein